MKLNEIRILDVWRALGGGELRGNRGVAFWRSGDGYSVSLNPDKGTWFDHRDVLGGGILKLVETVLASNRQEALAWLSSNVRLDPAQPQAPGDGGDGARDREDAYYFGIAARALAIDILTASPHDNPARFELTSLLAAAGIGGPGLIAEYQAWRESRPTFTLGLVHAGKQSEARTHRGLASLIAEKGLEDAA
jgi:hypothetical protein